MICKNKLQQKTETSYTGIVMALEEISVHTSFKISGHFTPKHGFRQYGKNQDKYRGSFMDANE